MNKGAYVLLAAMAIGTASCSGHSDDDRVLESFMQFQKGLAESDGAILWNVVDDSTRAYFDDFARSVRHACALVGENYPADERAAALRSVGGDILASARDGKSLFLFMLDARKLVPPGNPKAARVKEVRVNGSTATVVTKSGETVVFARNPGGTWGTQMFLSAFKELPAVMSLQDNIKVAVENCRMLGIDVDKYMSAK
jgi:hypothetical protein